jgi:E3 ubiquitin-protein ligase DOA10
MIECRICLEEYGPFIIPCKCDGTMKHVHENCLKKWAEEKLKKQVKNDEQKAKAKLSNIHGIECELCK